VVRRLGDADAVARHVAARRLRHVVRVDLERYQATSPRHSGSSSSYNTPAQDTLFWNPPPGNRARPCSSSTERSTTAAG
jgi:hypothetical protein